MNKLGPQTITEIAAALKESEGALTEILTFYADEPYFPGIIKLCFNLARTAAQKAVVEMGLKAVLPPGRLGPIMEAIVNEVEASRDRVVGK